MQTSEHQRHSTTNAGVHATVNNPCVLKQETRDMKKIAVFLSSAAILATTCLFPVRSEALLVVNSSVGSEPAVYDTVSKQYWYYSAYQVPNSTDPANPVSTIGSYGSQQDAIAQINVSGQNALGIYTWNMASRADFNALLISAVGGSDAFIANPDAAYALIINAFQNTSNYDLGTPPGTKVPANNWYNVVRWSGTPDPLGSNTPEQDVSYYENNAGSDAYLTATNADFILGETYNIGAFALSNAVPEPSTYVLLFIALSVIAGLRVVQQRGKKLALCKQASN